MALSGLKEIKVMMALKELLDPQELL